MLAQSQIPSSRSRNASECSLSISSSVIGRSGSGNSTMLPVMLAAPLDSRRMGREERLVVDNHAFDSLRLDEEIGKITPAKFCAFPCNGGNIRRGRKQLFHNRLAPRIDERKSVFVSGRRKRTAISQSTFLSRFELATPIQAGPPITRCLTDPVPNLIRLPPTSPSFPEFR